MNDSAESWYEVDNSGTTVAELMGGEGYSGQPSYDLNGNLQTYKGWTYTYDAQNRLRTAHNNGVLTATYYYDGKNRQIARNVNGAIRFNVWDGWEVIEEWSDSATRSAAYLQGATGIIKSWGNNGTFYYYQDKLGSTTHIANASGALLESYRYDLWGNPTYYEANGQPKATQASGHGIVDLYAGERWIPDLGLYDLRNRFMSSELGRFLQPDPIGFKGDGSNLYRYCHNDPENFADPMGLLDISANRLFSRLTSFNGGDWIKGSDGLSALDWNDKNSIRPQAGMGDNAGAGGPKSVSSENEGWKGPINFVAGAASYVRGIVRAGESIVGLSGLLGDKRKAEQQQALKDISAAGRLASDHPKATGRLALEALRRNSQNHTSRMGGRILAGMLANMVIIPVGKVAIPLGAITTPLAAYGDLTHTAISVRRNAETLNATHMLDSILTGNPRDKDP